MKWKHLLRYPIDRRNAQKALQNDPPVHSDWPNVGLQLASDRLLIDGARHLACLAIAAEQCRHRIVLRCNRVLLAAIAHKRLGKLFLSRPNVRWISPRTSFDRCALALSDSQADAREALRVIRLLVGRDAPEGLPALPYPMHPKQMLRWDESIANRLRSSAKAGIFFAGNQKARYGRDEMTRRFDVMPRLEILATLQSAFGDRISESVSVADDHSIVLQDSQKHPIAESDWFGTLSRHRFFVCCPGAAQPMCHNVIESMACGVVPILEYAHRFSVPLEDGKNAICFRGPEGLVQAIRRIDTLDESEFRGLQSRTVDYFEKQLRSDSTFRHIVQNATVSAIAMPFHDRNLYEDSMLPNSRIDRLAS